MDPTQRRAREAQLAQDLEEEVRRERQDEEERRRNLQADDWNINIWRFRSSNAPLMRSFQEELDLSEWDTIAEDLGLSYKQIKLCHESRYRTFSQEVFGLLERRPEHQDLTLRTFIELLQRHQRHDIILKLEQFARLGDFLPRLGGGTSTVQHNGAAVPTGAEEDNSTRTHDVLVQGEAEVLVSAGNIGSPDDKQPRFKARVLLIHAQDTKEEALQLASQLRRPVGERRLFLLLLQVCDSAAVMTSLRSDPWGSIHKWFMQVDVVVPVLSPQFLRQIHNRDLDEATEWEKRYNRYVYSMMMDQYVERGCKNRSCRAACPARFRTEVCSSEVMQHSLLFKPQWNCSSEEEVQELARIVYSSAKEHRKMKRMWREEQEQRKLGNNMMAEK